jgi:hypothetical protein
MDKELGAQRKARWETAFSATSVDLACDDDRQEEKQALGVNRKATIVLEHLIQASDVAHTMQHWDVYRKWVRLVLVLYRVPNWHLSISPISHYILAFSE